MLNGKVALVTGSTSGIGLGIARALAEAGASIMLNGLGDPHAIQATRTELSRETGVPVGFHGADMSRSEEIADMIEATARELGGPHILVNNAGIQHTDPIQDFPNERWEAIITINLSAAFYGTKFALPHMRAAGWGRIINTASAHGLVASVHKSAYVAAKHGIMGLTKVTALETAEEDITCNAINPGWVRTELVERQIEARAQGAGTTKEQAAQEFLAEKQPSMSFVTPEQLGQVAVFLCSDAASQITGIAVPVDGGWTAR